MRTRNLFAAAGLLMVLGIGAACAQGVQQQTDGNRSRLLVPEGATPGQVRDAAKALVVTPVQPGQELSVSLPVQFEFGKANLTPMAQGQLQALAAELTQAQGQHVRLRVEGHTDSVGGAQPNQVLSEQRAGSVVAFLMQLGMAPARLQAVGYGKSHPLPGIAGTDGRNRRVEFVRVQ